MIEFHCDITDEITGALISEDLPCEIEVEVIGEDVRVEDVRVDGISLYKGHSAFHRCCLSGGREGAGR